jgi:hypothetical protein
VTDRFRFALEHADASAWQIFEYLASAFLADEFGDIRTLASASGDGGRDSVLYQPDDDSTIAFQYSVATDWYQKIRKTARRLHDAHSEVRELVYMTSRRIGADADDIKRSLRRDFSLSLDVRDQSWFDEREYRSPATRQAAESFAQRIVDPILKSSSIIDRDGVYLTDDESRAALLFLVLQRQDDAQDRGLTKLCFDAIVKAILRDTDNENRMSRTDVHTRAVQLLPSHDRAEVELYIDRALERMNKRVLRHYDIDDTWLLNYDERTKVQDAVARLAQLEEDFDADILANLGFVAESLDLDLSLGDVNSLVRRVRRVIERYMYERGETFAESVASGQRQLFQPEDLEECIQRDLAQLPDTSSLRHNLSDLTVQAVDRILISHTPSTQSLLRSVMDGYTLFAFLRETPNVQSAVAKLFSQGEFWLDTTAVLPLLAETLLPSGDRGYTTVINAARSAGARFFVTSGVIEELKAHLDNSVQAWRNLSVWKSRTPFLLQTYIWSGRDNTDFRKWTENFYGSARPLDDLKIFLDSSFSVRTHDLTGYLENVPEELRWHSDAYWQKVHAKRRRQPGAAADETALDETVRRLAAHDSEAFLGILERRRGEQVNNPFGYTTWWLTLDSAARKASEEIGDRTGSNIPQSPVVDFEFLTYYLVVGPARRQLDKRLEQQLPIALDSQFFETLPQALLDAAEMARKDVQGQDERIVQRKIRDHLDAEKIRARRGRRQTGLDTIKADIHAALTAAES